MASRAHFLACTTTTAAVLVVYGVPGEKPLGWEAHPVAAAAHPSPPSHPRNAS